MMMMTMMMMEDDDDGSPAVPQEPVAGSEWIRILVEDRVLWRSLQEAYLCSAVDENTG